MNAQSPLLKIADIAARVRKSERWLQQQLADDRRRPLGPRLQFHDYMGKTPVWNESQAHALVSALKSIAERPASPLLNATVSGTSMAQSSRKDAESASERVLAFKPERSTGRKRKLSGSGSSEKSGANCEV